MAKRRSLKVVKVETQFDVPQYNNVRAITDGGKRKQWSLHDLKNIKPLTSSQKEMFYDFINGKNISASGSAGTGKTFVAFFLALNEILNSSTQVDRIIVVRSAVPTRDMGHMPGTLEEKVALYEAPYKDILHELIGRSSTYQDMKDAGVIEFQTTSYIRGVTWDNAVVLVDECQSMTFHEINTIMTRLGQNSRIIVVGDLPQTDLRNNKHDVTGMDKMLRVLKNIDNFSSIVFNYHDIVRSEFVKSWIIATEQDA